MTFPGAPLREDHFQGLGNIAGDAQNPLHTLLNRMRGQMGGGSYFVHPELDGAFPTIEEAVQQGESDKTDEVVPVLLANGFDHQLPGGGLDIDTLNDYIFAPAYPDDRLFFARTSMTGDIDAKATTERSGDRRSIVFWNLQHSGNFTIRENRRLIRHRGLDSGLNISVEHGTDGVGLYADQVGGNNGGSVVELDSPAGTPSEWNYRRTQLVFTDFFGVPYEVGGFGVRFENCFFSPFTFGTDAIFDFKSKTTIMRMYQCLFDLGGAGNTLMFANAGSATLRWYGRNSFDSLGTIAVDFSGPTHAGPWAPFISMGALPIGPPLGSVRLDRFDTPTWKLLSWNGSDWV